MRLQPFLRSSLQFAYQTHIQTKALRKFSPQLYWCTTYFHRCDTRFVLVISYIFNFVEFICIHTHKKANFSRRFCLCYCLKNCAKTKYVRRLYKKSYAKTRFTVPYTVLTNVFRRVRPWICFTELSVWSYVLVFVHSTEFRSRKWFDSIHKITIFFKLRSILNARIHQIFFTFCIFEMVPVFFHTRKLMRNYLSSRIDRVDSCYNLATCC